jgi:hypothetical protein
VKGKDVWKMVQNPFNQFYGFSLKGFSLFGIPGFVFFALLLSSFVSFLIFAFSPGTLMASLSSFPPFVFFSLSVVVWVVFGILAFYLDLRELKLSTRIRFFKAIYAGIQFFLLISGYGTIGGVAPLIMSLLTFIAMLEVVLCPEEYDVPARISTHDVILCSTGRLIVSVAGIVGLAASVSSYFYLGYGLATIGLAGVASSLFIISYVKFSVIGI